MLDFNGQPLMLGKAIIEGLKLINVDLDPFPYQILTSMGGPQKEQRLTK